MQAIAGAGHEVAGRGYAYEDFSALTLEEQDAVLQRSEATFQRVFGAKPSGFRAPDGLMTMETRGLLAARGYRYDSTYCDDDLPYVVANATAPGWRSCRTSIPRPWTATTTRRIATRQWCAKRSAKS